MFETTKIKPEEQAEWCVGLGYLLPITKHFKIFDCEHGHKRRFKRRVHLPGGTFDLYACAVCRDAIAVEIVTNRLAFRVSSEPPVSDPLPKHFNWLPTGLAKVAALAVALLLTILPASAALPTISSISPNSGSTAGGNTVTIDGTNLGFATSVTFGGTAASIAYNPSTGKLSPIVPAHAAGAVNVKVTTPGGSVTKTSGYTYVAPPPTISSISPNSGSTAGGNTVTIDGSNLGFATSVTFGGTAATIAYNGTTGKLQPIVPAHTAGTVNVKVTTPGGSVTKTGGYTYVAPPPTISSISPNSGSTAGGNTVTIDGSNLGFATSVTFGGTPATIAYNGTTGKLSPIVPAHTAGTVDVKVTTPGGSVTKTSGYTYVALGTLAPTVLTLAASSVGTTSATLNGRVTSNGGATITERRFEWAKHSGTWGTGTPGVDYGVIYDANITVSGNDFSAVVNGLESGTTYKYRVYARNSAGFSDVNLVNVMTFNTINTPSVPEIDVTPKRLAFNANAAASTSNAPDAAQAEPQQRVWTTNDPIAVLGADISPGEITVRFRSREAASLHANRLTAPASKRASVAGSAWELLPAFQGMTKLPEEIHAIRPSIAGSVRAGQLLGKNPRLAAGLAKGGVLAGQDVDLASNDIERGSEPHCPIGMFYLKVKAGSDLRAVCQKLLQRPDVAYAHPTPIARVASAPNDALFSRQWNLERMGMVTAWDHVPTSSNVRVAVIDTGVRGTHSDLVGQLVDAVDLDPSNDNTPDADEDGHGTMVAGVIGALRGNGALVAGIAPVKIIPINCYAQDANGGASITHWPEAIRYAVDHGAAVINCSFGRHGVPAQDELDAIEYARTYDVIVCAAAGNEDGNADDFVPASIPWCISVAAVDDANRRVQDATWGWGSNFGSTVDICAYGQGATGSNDDSILTLSHVSDTAFTKGFNGTSAATPHVAGLAALLKIAKPALTAASIRNVIQSTARDRVGTSDEDATGWDQFYGWGLIDAAATINHIQLVSDQAIAIRNIGTAPLSINSITLNSPAAFITWSPQGSFTVPSGESRVLTVSADVGSAPLGTTTRTLAIASNDADENPVNVTIEVIRQNTEPSISGISPQSTDEDTTANISFSVSDNETSPANLLVRATSSNQALVPDANLQFSGTDSQRSLVVTPAANGFGVATITISVDDTDNATTSTSFALTVSGINDGPTLDPVSNLTLNEDSNAQVNFSGISSGAPNEIQQLTVTAVSSNPDLVPHPVVNFTSPNSAGILMITPTANAHGAATVTVRVSDGGSENASVSRTFLVTVTPVNDPPALDPIADKTVHCGMQVSVTPTARDIDNPTGTLAFRLRRGPANSLVDASTGVFRWTSTDANAGQIIPVEIEVVDAGGLSDSKSFNIYLVARPTLAPPTRMENGSFQLRWSAISGQKYGVEFKNTLADSEWLLLPDEIRATGGTAYFNDSTTSPQRFYRVRAMGE